MKKIVYIIIWCVAIALLMPACSKKAKDELDFGAFEGSVYQNRYFGLSVTLPADWTPLDQEGIRELTEIGNKMLAGEDKNFEAALKASELTTVNLFVVYKHPLGAPVPFNSNITCVAEKISHFPGIRSGIDYLTHTRQVMEQSQMQFTFGTDARTVTLGGQLFDAIDVAIHFGDVTVRQTYHVAIMKGYALAFIITYSTKEEAAALHDILQTVAFR